MKKAQKSPKRERKIFSDKYEKRGQVKPRTKPFTKK